MRLTASRYRKTKLRFQNCETLFYNSGKTMLRAAETCPSCASLNIRPSKARSASESLQVAAGFYPFRCLDCSYRFSLFLWPLAPFGVARCPRCLGSRLHSWPQKRYRPSATQRILAAFGARRYRCPACRYYFVSFRRTSRRNEETESPASKTD
jgi:transposase-like protein